MSRNCEGFDLRGTYEHTLGGELEAHEAGSFSSPRRDWDPAFQEEAG